MHSLSEMEVMTFQAVISPKRTNKQTKQTNQQENIESDNNELQNYMRLMVLT